MKYNPYDFSEVTKLLQYFYSLGWYSKTLDLLTITMQGGFEAFTGRASETWEHRFIARNCAIPELDIEAHEAHGTTIGDACRELRNIIEQADKRLQADASPVGSADK